MATDGTASLPAEAKAGLFDNAPDGILLVQDSDYSIIAANQAFCDMIGSPAAEIVGQPLLSFILPSDAAARPLEPGRAQAGAVVTNERRLIRRDGSSIWCETTTRAVAGSYEVFVRDISVRKELEAQVAQRQTRIRNILELSDAMSAAGPEPEALFRAVTSHLAVAIGDLAVLTMRSPSSNDLVPVAYSHRHPDSDALIGAIYSGNPGAMTSEFAGAVNRTGQPVVAGPMDESQLLASIPQAMHPYVRAVGISHMIIVPVHARRDALVGTLGVCRDRDGRPFDAEDRSLLEAVATRVGIAIENTQLQQQLRMLSAQAAAERIAREFQTSGIQQIFSAGLRLQGVARRVTDTEIRDQLTGVIRELDQSIIALRSALYLPDESEAEPDFARRSLELVARMARQLRLMPAVAMDDASDRPLPAGIAQYALQALHDMLASCGLYEGMTFVNVTIAVDELVTITAEHDGTLAPHSSARAAQGHRVLRDSAEALGGSFTATAADRNPCSWSVPV